MQAMEAFHDLLFSDSDKADSLTQALARLTQAEPDQIATLDSARTWTDWFDNKQVTAGEVGVN